MANTWVEVRELAEANAAVGGTFEDILSETLTQGILNNLVVEIKNTGAAALTDCSLLVKASEDAAGYQTLITSTAFATLTDTLKAFSGEPHTLAAGASAFLRINLGGVYAFKIQAKCGTTTTTTVNGLLSRIA